MKKLAYLFVMLIPIFWGTTLPMTKSLVDNYHLNSTFVVFLRMLTTLLLLTPFAIRKMEFDSKIFKNAMVVGTFLGFGYVFQFASINYISSSLAGAIGSFTVIVIAFMSYVLFKRKVSKYTLMAIPFAVTGSMLAALSSNVDGSTLGIMFALFATFSYAFQASWNGEKDRGSSPLVYTFYMMMFGTLITGLATVFEIVIIGDELGTLDLTSLSMILFLTIFATAFPFYSRNIIYTYISTTKATLFFSTELIFTVLISAIVYGEVVNTQTIIGIIFIIVAISIAQQLWKAFKIDIKKRA